MVARVSGGAGGGRRLVSGRAPRGRRDRTERSDARLRVPRRRGRGDPSRPALERPTDGCAVRGHHAEGGRRAPGRDHRQPGAHGVPGAQGALAPRRGAGAVRARRGRAAAEGLRPAPADRRGGDRRLGRSGHLVPRSAGQVMVLGGAPSARRARGLAAAGPRGAGPIGRGNGGGRRRARARGPDPGRGRRRRQRRGGGRDGGDACRSHLELDRDERRALRARRRGRRGSVGPDPRVRARRARSVLPAGGHALGGRLAALVARRDRPRLRRARRRGRDRPDGERGSRVPSVPHGGADAASRSARDGCVRRPHREAHAGPS